MKRPNVLLVYPLPAESGEELLRSEVNVIRPDSDRPADIGRALCDADAIILRGPARLDAEQIAEASALKVIGTPGSGVDPIDVAAATKRGIPVVHTPGVAPRGIAEYAMSAMVIGHRKLLGMHEGLLAKPPESWPARLDTFVAMELTGTTLGIVGYGFIGRTLARMAAAAYEMEVLAYDPFVHPEEDGLGPVQLVGDLDELLSASTTVSIHCPLTSTTRGLIGRRELDLIGPDGVIINTARGGIVDERALIDALTAGAIKAAVLDVFDPEPPTAEQLARLAATPNLVVTPHVAGVTHRALHNISVSVAEGVLAVLRGERASIIANPEIYRA